MNAIKISIIILFTSTCFGQEDYPMKESYDYLIEPQYYALDYNDPLTLWWQGSDVHIFVPEECNTCQPIGQRAENPTTDNTNQTKNTSTIAGIVEPRMVLYPNPTQRELTIVLENDVISENFDFFVYNFSGTLVHSGSSNERTSIYLNLSSGMYLVKVKTEEIWYTEKLSIR
jgi:hypothetical protein